MAKKRIITLLVAATLSTTAGATINTEMQSFFNEMGVYGNVTGPTALRGQTGTVFAGGNLYMRMPQRNFQIASFAPPGIKAGCGGIDLFAGSFSFINAEQLTALLRNLANNAIGVAFQLAIESISPELAGLLKWAQDQASKINNMNLNSCQLAQGLVTAAWPDQAVAERFAARVGLDPAYNFASDSWKARWNIFNNPPSQTAQESNTIANNNPKTKEVLSDVNVVWNALNRIGITDSELKELMMSLTGTVVIRRNKSNDEKPDISYVAPPEKISFKQFIGDPNTASTTIKIMKCPDNDCLNPGQGTTTAASFAKYTQDRINGIITKVKNRQANSLTADEYKFIQGTYIPVWKIATMGQGHAESLASAMSQLIAMDLAYTYFNEISKELQKAVMGSKASDSSLVKEQLEKIEQRITDLRQEATQMMTAEATHVHALLSMRETVAKIRQEVVRGLSESVQNSVKTFQAAR